VIGENRNFIGPEDLFSRNGIAVAVLDDPECVSLMRTFVAEHPDLWNEDIGK
jgi:cytosine deaminase